MSFWDLFKKKKDTKNDKNRDKYRIGMEKTRKNSMSKLSHLLEGYHGATDDFFDELEEIFVEADMGVDTTLKFVDELREDPRIETVKTAQEMRDIIIDKMFNVYLKGEIVNANLKYGATKPSVFLFVGVNGVGKTTTIAKIAHRLQNKGQSVVLAAGDTFRAGAIDQLKVWGERLNVPVVAGKEGADPSSVAFDAIKYAKEHQSDVVLVDTAGRLQNKKNLMDELAKIRRVISREIPDAPSEVLLIIDATTGQNGLNQAKAFLEATNVTGVILTKMDGSSKGGIVLAIRDVYGLPIKYVGLGESMDDLEPFDLENYIYGLFSEMLESDQE